MLSFYCSPSTCPRTALEDFHSVLLALSDHCKHFIIAGDFNIDLLSDSSVKEDYINLQSDFCLVQHLTEPSCIYTSATLIDHVVTSMHTHVQHIKQFRGGSRV